jgi:hypothetical protein
MAPPRPSDNVEPSHRIDEEEFYRLLEGFVIGESGLFEERLREWQDHYEAMAMPSMLGSPMQGGAALRPKRRIVRSLACHGDAVLLLR